MGRIGIVLILYPQLMSKSLWKKSRERRVKRNWEGTLFAFNIFGKKIWLIRSSLFRYGRTNAALDREKEKLAALADRVKTAESSPAP